MIDQKVLKRYQKLRHEQPTMAARWAYQAITSEWCESRLIADSPHEIDGFEVHVKTDYDEYMDDLSYLGEYQSNWDAEAIDLWARYYGTVLNHYGERIRIQRRKLKAMGKTPRQIRATLDEKKIPPYFFQDPLTFISRPNFSRYWVPAQTYDDHYQALLDLKFGHTEADRIARENVKRDFERMEAVGKEWWMECVIVKVYRNGIELGNASCGGIESDSGHDTFEEIAGDLVEQALAEARVALDGLCLSR